MGNSDEKLQRENRVDSGVNKQEVTVEAQIWVRSLSSLTEGEWNENEAQKTGVMMEVRAQNLRCEREKRGWLSLTEASQGGPRRPWYHIDQGRSFQMEQVYKCRKWRLLARLSQGSQQVVFVGS